MTNFAVIKDCLEQLNKKEEEKDYSIFNTYSALLLKELIGNAPGRLLNALIEEIGKFFENSSKVSMTDFNGYYFFDEKESDDFYKHKCDVNYLSRYIRFSKGILKIFDGKKEILFDTTKPTLLCTCESNGKIYCDTLRVFNQRIGMEVARGVSIKSFTRTYDFNIVVNYSLLSSKEVFVSGNGAITRFKDGKILPISFKHQAAIDNCMLSDACVPFKDISNYVSVGEAYRPKL